MKKGKEFFRFSRLFLCEQVNILLVGAVLLCFALALYEAYNIRLLAIITYGKIIHEFDPWFNFRATEYLASHNLAEFFTWYDHESWYPLGRPVGTTIYPGLQIIAVWLWRTLNSFGIDISLNDVCVYFPAWFGTLATFLLGLLAWEASGNMLAAGIAALVMSIIPAHLMRSVGGGFDNESLAISCMVGTFLLWVRSVRTPSSWYIGVFAGMAELAMAAAWGGYVFVANMVGLHAGLLLLMGRYNSGLHKAYSLWWIIGQLGATSIPVINSAPYRSLEQIGPLGIFAIMQLLAFVDFYATKKSYSTSQKRKLMLKLFTGAAIVVGVVGLALLFSGFFGPISVRVRSLFLKHSRTGNPLVDSVAEHQPASAAAYRQYLNAAMFLAPVGLVMMFFHRSNAGVFLILYGIVAYYFAQKMNRLIILMGPIASALTGVAVASMLEWIFVQIAIYVPALQSKPAAVDATPEDRKKSSRIKVTDPTPFDSARSFYKSKNGKAVRFVGAILLSYILITMAIGFVTHSKYYAVQISQPSLMFQTRLSNGQEVIIDDYVVGYKWIKQNTPTDSRVLSWWDYGYQIAGIANRTTLADGNTWNLEHIALIGKMLTSSQEKSHKMVRHLADYVLVWAGGGGDDLAKMPHVARIASSVYAGICDGDPMCRQFMFDPRSKTPPHKQVQESLLFNLVMNNRHEKAKLDERYYKEVFTSKYGLLRVYRVLDVDQKSRAWGFNPRNRLCDRPGSWYCPGQYPPAIQKPPSSHRAIDYEKTGFH